MPKALLDLLVDKRDEITKPANDLIALAERESRNLTGDEFATVQAITAGDELRQLDERIAAVRTLAPTSHDAPAVIRSEPNTYRQQGEFSHVRDTILATTRNDADAWDRLRRHAKEVAVESRDITRTDGAGGEFVPPLWLVDMFGDFPRPGRVVADMCTQLPLPAGTDSINLPRITTGPQVAVQTADNAAVQETDLVSATVTAPVRTIAGQQDVAIQLVEQSPLAGGIDQMIYAQLLADYERALGIQIWNGSGAAGQVLGILNTAGIGAVTYTDASPTVPELYLPLAQAINTVEANSYLAATAIVGHGRRWNWMSSALDAQNRPLVVPTGAGAYMALGTNTAGSKPKGLRGEVLGVGFYTDNTIPTGLGAGTNEDRVIVGDFKQAYLMEGAVRTRVLPDVLSGNLTVRFQLYRYVAFTAGVRPTAFAAIAGTGLVQPSGF